MYRDGMAMEHYRMHVMEQWPESASKDAGLAAVRSKLESLQASAPAGEPQFVCSQCLSNHSRAKVIQFPAPVVRMSSRLQAA